MDSAVMPPSPDVVLLRSADDPDPYVTSFAEAGLTAICEPVLSFAFPHQAALLDRLEKQDHYAGLIVTSPRALRALGDAFLMREQLADAWRGTPAYVVGPKTAGSAEKLDLRPRGRDSGGADALADRIITDAPDAPLLFLSGNRRRDALPDRLRAAGVPFEEQVVYETRVRDALDLPPPPHDGQSWLVFFSPSGLEAVQQADSVEPTSYQIAAIGPTTGSALERAGLTVEAVAEVPSPEGLVAAILRNQDE